MKSECECVRHGNHYLAVDKLAREELGLGPVGVSSKLSILAQTKAVDFVLAVSVRLVPC